MPAPSTTAWSPSSYFVMVGLYLKIKKHKRTIRIR